MKIAVPVTAFAGAVIFVFFAYFNPFRAANITVDVGQVSVSNDKLVMELPHLTGFNKRQQAYNVTAKSASQKVSAPGLIDLTNLDAVISMVDKSSTTLTAAKGKFDSNAEIMSLHENVKVKSTKGYDAVMKSGTINFKAGTVVSSEPVTVNLANGRIEGNGLNIVDGGGRILFQGGVTAHFKTPRGPDADAEIGPSVTTSGPADSSTPAQGSPSP